MAATMATRSFSTIGAGVPLGQNTANQLDAATSRRPCSRAVGRSGSRGERSLVSTAIALTVPASTWATEVGLSGHW